ncbi:MAG: hypothetical protein WCK51_10875 [Armatimonadota bacterium]
MESNADRAESFSTERDDTMLKILHKMTPTERVEYHEGIMREIFEIWEQNGIVPLRWRTDELSEP